MSNIYPTELKRINRQITRAEEKVADLKTERDVLVKQAHEKGGMKMLEIANLLGVTKGLVWQIIHEYRKK